MSKIISQDDFREVRLLAKKYNMSVADFGRSVVRQSERSVGRTIRLSDEEYDYIVGTAKKNGMTSSRFCALACHAFLEVAESGIMPTEREGKKNRTKRVEARFYNSAEEAEIVALATMFSMRASQLIRYCALRFDGEKINL